MAALHGWQSIDVSAGQFLLRSYIGPSAVDDDDLTIYIEGDGLSWLTRNTISNDPTPVNPIALGMALNQPSGVAAYLARPCQYAISKNRNCHPEVWANARFSQEVIDAMSQGVDVLKHRYQAKRITLVGYSGGGAIAMLISRIRDDVAGVVTVAGNLDHRAWTDLHRVTPLYDSLNPADYASELVSTSQMHLVGGADSNMPVAIVEAYSRRLLPVDRPPLKVIPKFDHACCWVEEWRDLYGAYVPSLRF
jgi:dienelactone hydrolase